jgi:hypothetical protein
MNKLTILAFAAATLLAATGAASAQYYTGPGFGDHIGPRYDESQYHRRGYDRERYAEDRGYRRSRLHCGPHYTVQDGVCKPYRGY